MFVVVVVPASTVVAAEPATFLRVVVNVADVGAAVVLLLSYDHFPNFCITPYYPVYFQNLIAILQQRKGRVRPRTQHPPFR